MPTEKDNRHDMLNTSIHINSKESGMLVKFTSTATGSITMFGDAATQLIKMLGATGKVPGALSAEDLPAAIAQLKAKLLQHASAEGDVQEDDEEQPEQPISLATRAAPLIDLLQRSSDRNAPVMWEALR
jgi:hypothetical protein